MLLDGTTLFSRSSVYLYPRVGIFFSFSETSAMLPLFEHSVAHPRGPTPPGAGRGYTVRS